MRDHDQRECRSRVELDQEAPARPPPVAGSRLPVGSSARTDARLLDQRARHRDPLLLAAGKLARPVLDALRRARRARAAPARALARRVAAGRRRCSAGIMTFSSAVKSGEQMVELEDEADLAVAETRQLAVALRRQVLAIEPHLAARRPIERAQDVQQRALADPGLPDDGDALAGADVEIEPGEHPHHPRTVDVLLGQVAQRDQRRLLVADHFHGRQTCRLPRGVDRGQETDRHRRERHQQEVLAGRRGPAASRRRRRPSAARRTGSARAASSPRSRRATPSSVPTTPMIAPFSMKIRRCCGWSRPST